MTVPNRGAVRGARAVALASAAICAGSCAFGAPAVRAAGSPATLTPVAWVHFAHRVKVHSLVGFLHGLGDKDPSDRVVMPLHPTLWRGSLFSASFERAEA